MSEQRLIKPGKWFVEFNEQGEITNVCYDDSYREMLGFVSFEEYQEAEKNWVNRIHPEDAQRLDAHYEECCKKHPEGMDYDIEYRMMTKRGYRWFHDYGHCIRSNDGSLLRCDGVIFDIDDIRNQQIQLSHEKLREDIFAYIVDNSEQDPIELLKTFAERIRELLNCDQVIYRDLEETRIMVNSDGIANTWSVPIEYCMQCQHFNAHHPMYKDGYTLMDDCQEGWQGIPVYEKCPIKSSLTRIVYCNDEVAGYLAVHFVQNYHKFTELEQETVEIFTRILSVALTNYTYKNRIKELNSVKNNLQMFFSLSDQYDPILLVDPETGEYDWLMNMASDVDKNTSMSVHGENLYKNIGIDAASIIYEDDREQFKAFYTKENMMKIAETGIPQEIENRWFIETENKYKWKYNKAVKMVDESGKAYVVVGVIDTTEKKEKEQQEKKLMQEYMDNSVKIAEQAAFTSYFLKPYMSVYYISFDDLSTKVYKRTEQLEKDYPIIHDYFTSVCEYINKEVDPDNRAEFIELMRPENMKKLLKEREEFSYVFKSTYTGATQYIRLQVIRGADEAHAAFGFIDITQELIEQKRYLLGDVPLSPDVLTKANIGLWSFELDEGSAPRMYVDDTMLGLIGLDHQVTPEETYHAWYDNIDKGSYDVVHDAVDKMCSGEHAEVQYPWHNPSGETIIVRCGGVRNFGYTKGIRIEGTHQNVTAMLHYDEEMQKREKEDLSLKIISSLSEDYATLYYIDGETSEYQLLSKDITYNDKINTKLYHGNNFFEDAKKSTPRVVYEEDREKIEPLFNKKVFEKHFDGKDSFTIDYRLVIDENIVWYRVKAVKIVDKDDSVNYAVGVINIEGELKRQKMLEEALNTAQTASNAKTEFLFNMSHDIRTPMNAILGYTDIALKHSNEQEKVTDSLYKIKTAGGHLLSLINDILEMSRIEAGKLEIVNVPMNILNAVDGIRQMSEALAMNREINFKTVVGKIDNPFICADELHINQIIINLISNAIKYTNPGGNVEYHVEQISAPLKGIAKYRLTFIDDGIGMSEEFQKHLFENFSRENTSTVSKQEGAGLGLSIVKRILDAVNGTITVKSKKGVGSTFTVVLPFKVLTEEEVIEFNKDNNNNNNNNNGFEGKKLLIVEDNDMNREIVSEILEEEGFIIDTAEDGSIAVEKIKKNGPDYYDFVLMDIQMPVMNGYEATKKIRSLYPKAALPIIAVSANAFEEDKQASTDAGMNDHIAKPIDVKTLKQTLIKFLK